MSDLGTRERHDRERGGLIGGLILVMLGLALLAMQFTSLGGGAVVCALGLAFFIAYALTRRYGLLVPAGVLTGLGGGILAQQVGAADASVVLGLGLGFIAIWVVDLLTSPDRASGRWWPLIPGGVLTAVGAFTALPGFQRYLPYVWPAALIAAGALLIARAMSNRTAQ